MKSTLALLGLLMAGLVAAQEPALYVIFAQTGSTDINFTLGDVIGTMTKTGGQFYRFSDAAWKNDAALAAMNAELHTALTETEVNSFLASGWQDSFCTLTLDFGQSAYEAGQEVSVYFTLGESVAGNLAVTVTGLEDFDLRYAVSGGSGFDADAPASVPNSPTLVQLTGRLTEGRYVNIIGSATKSGFGMVSLAPPATIPEPATATLSLLALTGLCARRRRK